MKKPVILISTAGKTSEQIDKEIHEAYKKLYKSLEGTPHALKNPPSEEKRSVLPKNG